MKLLILSLALFLTALYFTLYEKLSIDIEVKGVTPEYIVGGVECIDFNNHRVIQLTNYNRSIHFIKMYDEFGKPEIC